MRSEPLNQKNKTIWKGIEGDLVTLYSTHCPKCVILEKKLNQKKIEYQVVDDVDLMEEKGFLSLPMLEVEGAALDFGEAVRWVNEHED